MTHIGFSLQAKYSLPTEQMIAHLKDCGFSAVSPVWSPETDMDALAACVREHGMTIQSLHAPLAGISRLWEPDFPDSAPIQDGILGCIDACAQFSVPVMVIHGWQGLIYTFPEDPLDFRFFDRMVDYAREKGVCVAFENLEGEEFLCALLERYRDRPHVGFCWDSGHDNCYPHQTDFLAAFGDRLIMTHINDNLGLRDPGGAPSGDDDLHFLPYDGHIDWVNAMGRMKAAPRQATLNFELKIRSNSSAPEDLPYTRISVEQFLKEAGIRARRIADLYEATLTE